MWVMESPTGSHVGPYSKIFPTLKPMRNNIGRNLLYGNLQGNPYRVTWGFISYMDTHIEKHIVSFENIPTWVIRTYMGSHIGRYFRKNVISGQEVNIAT